MIEKERGKERSEDVLKSVFFVYLIRCHLKGRVIKV